MICSLARVLLAFSLFAAAPAANAEEEREAPRWALAIHGGAGVITRERMSPEREEAYEAALVRALEAGTTILSEGGSAIDAVAAVIVLLEDDPRFNAGRGAVFTWEGTNELDAAIMDGRDRSAGAATGLTSVRNPILLADAIRRDGRHVFLSGEGAAVFARDTGLLPTPPDWFYTPERYEALERLKARELSVSDVDHKFGTVGAVALDRNGDLAAGTSTGGLTGKRWGRIGDAPVIGAGTYADNRACAVSATGAGEYFIRVGVARMICARMRLAGEGPKAAADAVLAEVAELGGDGGVIVLSPEGEPTFSFNTEGMYRARATSEGLREVAIFAE